MMAGSFLVLTSARKIGSTAQSITSAVTPSVCSKYPLNPSTRKIQTCDSNCATGLIISPRIIIHIPNLVLVGVYLLKPTKRRTIKVCPRTVRMYADAQISGVFPDIVCTGSEVHFCRCPDTGLARRPVPIRCVENNRWKTQGYSTFHHWLPGAI